MTGRRWLLLVVMVVPTAYWLMVYLKSIEIHDFNDLDVYRAGAEALWLNLSPYEPTFNESRLPFTYPPFATLIFVPLGILPLFWSEVAMTTLSIAALAGIIMLALQAAPKTARWAKDPLVVGGLVCAGVLTEPVRDTLALGQINLVLTFLVMYDALVLTPRQSRYRGIIIGLCAAVKLTPAIFVLWFFARRDVRGLAGTVGGFFLGAVVGFMAMPIATLDYWTKILFDTTRIGPGDIAGNQAISGLLARLGEGHADRLAWFVLSVPVIVACTWLARRYCDAGKDLLALLVVAMACLLASPISWSHHWVWAIPALILLASSLTPSRVGLALFGLAVLWAGPQWRMPHRESREQHWTPLQAVIGNFYVWAALAILAVALIAAWEHGRVERPAPVGNDDEPAELDDRPLQQA